MKVRANLVARALETILVVDNDEIVLSVVVAILESAHFRVLSARSATDAIQIARDADLKIDLLLSDVDMPGMSGPALGLALRKSRSDLRVMFMSGGDHGLLVLNYGWAFLPKPFFGQTLIQMVENVLYTAYRAQQHDEFDLA